MKKMYWFIGAGAVAFMALGMVIYSKMQVTADKNKGNSSGVNYKSITMEEAKELFAEPGDYLILDVRRTDEFAQGHIPGAINIANEEIGAERPEKLSDLNKVIYVYCRSGRRSKEAATKLATMGYTSIIECGGILDWTGEVEE